jgi:hypothetical protein
MQRRQGIGHLQRIGKPMRRLMTGGTRYTMGAQARIKKETVAQTRRL